MAAHALTIKNTLTLAAGTSITKGGAVLSVNSVSIPSGAYSGGTINP
jgi:hypothetical protein